MSGTLAVAPHVDRDFAAWWAKRRRAHQFTVCRIPFADLVDWRFAAGTGDLVHRSGRFFTVCGLRSGTVTRPILSQPEIGVLGILVKRIDGEPHCLLQAKMEPGNVNTVQLSPTVQATRSNYTRVHRGAPVRYLDYFTTPGRGRVLADSLQSEHGAWFHHKRNRNLVVETDEDVPVHEDFHWLPLAALGSLLTVPNLVNMDARTVLACLLGARGATADPALLSWFTDAKARHDRPTALVDLAAVPGWGRTATELRGQDGDGPTVLAVSVTAPNREATVWTQPLLAPPAPGVVAFLARTRAGRTELLVRARPEIGCRDSAELGPTVQTGTGQDEPLLATVLELAADPARVWYDTVLSEEGGRLWYAQSRYLVVETDGDTADIPAHEDFRWADLAGLTGLLRHSYYLNVQARTLLASLALACGRRR